MDSQPTPHALARECGAIVTNAAKNETKTRRVIALEYLVDLLTPIDVANDLDKLGLARALIDALSDADEDVASGAASALAAAASNNGVVQGIIYDKGGVDVLLNLIASLSTPSEVRHRALLVLGMCARTHAESRAKFFAEDGAHILADILALHTPAKTRTRGMVLFGDMMTIDGVAALFFADEARARELLGAVTEQSVSSLASLDDIEKSLTALDTAAQFGPEVVKSILRERIDDFLAIATRLEGPAATEDDAEYALDVARVARALIQRIAAHDEL
jgi:hypothetical protein